MLPSRSSLTGELDEEREGVDIVDIEEVEGEEGDIGSKFWDDEEGAGLEGVIRDLLSTMSS